MKSGQSYPVAVRPRPDRYRSTYHSLLRFDARMGSRRTATGVAYRPYLDAHWRSRDEETTD